MQNSSEITLYGVEQGSGIELPLSGVGVSAGFPSMVDDFVDMKIDLNRELIKNPASTFYARVSGVSMIDDGIDDGDLLVIDRSIEPTDNSLAVCYIDGEFTLKRFVNKGDYGYLVPANKRYKPIKVTSENEFKIWGIVSYVVKKM